MASPILLPPAFDGMAQDFPRNNLPKGKAWNLVDFIPEALGAPATERGGWSFASPALTGVDASATYVKALLEAPFNAGAQLIAIDDNAKLIKIVGGVNTLITGTCNMPVQNPFMHQQTVVIPSPDGTTAPQKYDGTTVVEKLAFSDVAGNIPCGSSVVRFAPSAGNHTYQVKAWVDAGTGFVLAGAGTAGAYAPARLRITQA